MLILESYSYYYLSFDTTRHHPPIEFKALDPSATAIQWLIETSTDPEILEIVTEQVSQVEWSPLFDSLATFERLWEILDVFWYTSSETSK